MCGIAGFVNLDGRPVDEAVLSAMTAMVHHRGPDDRGTLCCSLAHDRVFGEPQAARSIPADVAVGFHRLNILDLSIRGHQPMLNASATVAIAYNGEIYNAFDLRPELEALGYQFRSRTDTEVILYLYEHYGLDGMLERLNGMFAIVLVDLRHRQVHVVRDHFGIKPMYWTQAGQTLLFASEAKAFLAHPEFRAEIDSAYVDELLVFRYIAGDRSLLKNVNQLRPGHRLKVSQGRIAVERYWAIPDGTEKAAIGFPEAVEECDRRLRHSVKSQLLSDVKLGCQLSGGIDSSLVTVLAREHFAADLDTFSVIFNDPAFSKERWITQAAAAAQADSHRFVFSEDFFIGTIDRATWHMDQPISHPNSIGIWLLAQHARQLVTVLLSGEGADEVFGGYTRFYYAQLRQRIGRVGGGLRWVPRVGGRLAPHFEGDPAEAFVMASSFLPAPILSRLRPGADLRAALDRRMAIFGEGRGDHLSNCLKYEMQTYMADLLVRQDKMTMAHSVENRVPFLDRDLVHFARHLPSSHLVGSTIPTDAGRMRGTKIVVKALASRVFDDAFVHRRKSGFALPLAQYFRAPRFVSLMEDQLLPGMQARGLVEVPVVRRMWQRALSAPATTESFWTVVALELFAQKFVDGRAH